jgi:hypothetical protein
MSDRYFYSRSPGQLASILGTRWDRRRTLELSTRWLKPLPRAQASVSNACMPTYTVECIEWLILKAIYDNNIDFNSVRLCCDACCSWEATTRWCRYRDILGTQRFIVKMLFLGLHKPCDRVWWEAFGKSIGAHVKRWIADRRSPIVGLTGATVNDILLSSSS